MSVIVANKEIGRDKPIFFAAEIGINHNGDLEIAKKLIDMAVEAKCDAVKFQKRNPEVAVPEHQKNLPRETPWGTMTYIEYKRRIMIGHALMELIEDMMLERGLPRSPVTP